MLNITQTKRRLPFMRQLLLVLLLVTAVPAFALTFTVDGLTYETLSTDGEVKVSRCETTLTGELKIPSTVNYDGTTYRVTSIGGNAFSRCSELTSITIPTSVTSIGEWAFFHCSGLTTIIIPSSVTSIDDYAFYECTGLTSITLPGSLTSISNGTFEYCSALTSITIPDGVTSIGPSAFEDCTGLTSITIPNSVTSIGNGAFSWCTGLTSITIPNSVTSIGVAAFYKCTGLTSVTLPGSLTSISDRTFDDCSNLTSITIPDGVTSIGSRAFEDCSRLTSLTLPESVKNLEGCCFSGCTLRPLKILSKDEVTFYKNASYGPFAEMNGESEIACYSVNYQSIRSIWYGTGGVYMIDQPKCEFSHVTPYLKAISFVYGNPYYEGGLINKEYCAEIPGTKIKDFPIALNKDNYIDGLKVDTQYTLRMYEKSNPVNCSEISFRTLKPTLSINYKNTETTITINSITGGDKSCAMPTITVAGKEYKGEPMKITGLRPNQEIQIRADYDGYILTKNISTRNIIASILSSTVYPNSIECVGKPDVGDAKFAGVEWTYGSETVSESNNLVMTGLVPDKDYSVTFTVKVTCADGSTYTRSNTIKKHTSKLELVMQTPKCVGNGKAIVSATTNISESETNVGFEWKKYDAPSSLPYSRGFTAICDGHIEGLIQNLQAAYYNVRAFYRDAAGKYYYTAITTFDPTDFSYFEPTVHTYPAETEDNQVTLRGYALGGTDNITSQGFQYWIVNNDSQSAGRYSAPAADADIKTVKANGQRMEAVINNLESGVTYAYRAFVETEAGMTYGEEQTFDSPVVDGIEGVTADEAEVTIVGYFDINGRRYDAPQRGFNIVLYSDGTARKIISK